MEHFIEASREGDLERGRTTLECMEGHAYEAELEEGLDEALVEAVSKNQIFLTTWTLGSQE